MTRTHKQRQAERPAEQSRRAYSISEYQQQS
jgi:hypothetical protein